MRIAFHIVFYYKEDRVRYLNEVIEGLNNIPGDNKIFVYTNKNISSVIKGDRGNITLLRFFYSLELLKPFYKWRGKYPYNHWSRKLGLTFFIHPFYLTWEPRSFMRKWVDDYDVQVYLEDDILFTDVHFKYWMDYKDLCLKHDYNLGFLRYEVNEQTKEVFYNHGMCQAVKRVIHVEGKPFLINDDEPYCAFWIMDKQELKKFIKSPEWRFEIEAYDERAISAVGWHGLQMTRYKGTILPLIKMGENSYRVVEEALVHHLPNNYIGHGYFCRIKHPLIFEGQQQD
jgi:hypothetical protein